jgi:glycosyltransferase
VPAIRHLFGTVSLPPIELDARGEPLPEYTRMFAARGLPVLRTPAAVVDPTPPSMRLAAWPGCLDMRYVPYNGPGLVPDWLTPASGRPRVCVTWGHTSARALGGSAAEPYREAIEALVELGAEIIVVTTAEQLELLGPVPAGVRTAASVPLNLIMPGCDLLVQQGGDGTTLTAAAAGVPSLVISRKPDAELPAGRLAAIGAGVHLRYQELRDDQASRQVIRDALEKLLVDSAYRDAAGRLAAEIERQPAPADVVPALLELAG